VAVSDTTAVAVVETGPFTADQVEILSAQRVEPEWLRERRRKAYEEWSTTPMPTRREEEWRYTDIAKVLQLDALQISEERRPVAGVADLPDGLRALIEEAGESSARLVQVDASVVYRELPQELAAQGVVFTSLEQAVREHGELVKRYLDSGLGDDAGKFAALNQALWTGGSFLYVPANVRVEIPLRSFRWLSGERGSLLGRTLIVAEPFSEIAVIDELASGDFEAQTFANSTAEIFASEGSKVTYIQLQRWGRGVVHLTTDRLIAERDSKITTLYTTLGSDVTRADVKCRMRGPGAHVDMLGLYLAEGTQHFDHETLQDHIAPHATSNLLYKGALNDTSRSVFRGMIRVHPGAQRTDSYQTNRNLILSGKARADSLPNLEIGADDVRCSHAATVGQLDEEEIFYLLSRGIPKVEAIKLVIFGFFGEVLRQLELDEVRNELVRAIERKVYARK
jgi:Fe-S cluster assembly protein SufD